MSKPSRMARSLRSLLIFSCCGFLALNPSFAAGASSCESDAAWPETSKKLDELAGIAQCGPTFTQSECRANLGLIAGGAAVGVAAAVGAKAATRVRAMPKLCGLRGVVQESLQPSSFVATLLASLVPSAHAACVDPSQEMARHVRQEFSVASAEIEEQIRSTGRERLKKDFPELTKNVDEQIKIQREINGARAPSKANGSYHYHRDVEQFDDWRKAQSAKLFKLQDEAAQMIGTLKIKTENGRITREQIRLYNNPAAQNLDNAYHELFASRANALDPIGAEKRTYLSGITSRYSYDYARSTETLKKLRVLETEIATKSVSPERLAAMLDDLAERAPTHQLGRLATLRQSLTERFKLPAAGTASRMAREGSKLIGKAGARVGGGLFAVVTAGVAHANDADGSVKYGARVVEEFVGASHLGCGTIDSDWATIEGAGDCSYRPRWNAATTDFALQPEDVQRKELAKHPQLCGVIDKVYNDLSAPGLSVSCQPSGAILRDDRRRITMDVAYDESGLVKRASVTGNGVYASEYELQFSGDQFEKLRIPSITGAVYSTAPRIFTEPKFKTTDITRAMVSDGRPTAYTVAMSKSETHFATMQPHIQAAQACCSGTLESSDPRCGPMVRGKASGGGTSTGTVRPTSR